MPAHPLGTERLAERHPRDGLFDDDLRSFISDYVELWSATGTDTPVLEERWSPREQISNERELDRLTDLMEERLMSYPDEEAARRDWRNAIALEVRRFAREHLRFPDCYLDLLSAPEYFQSTQRFVAAARSFDPELEMEDLFQALRNVWIMNSMQLFLELGISFTPAIFAYSMLYPYTDNYIDAAGVSPAMKARAARRLQVRLQGLKLTPDSARERDVFRLVALIEEEHPRHECPQVYRSLLAIHRAQVRSLRQQGTPPLGEEILDISVEKGGSSVLADGYLVAGDLSREEARFFFGYGVFLQLLDDLQDVRQDSQCSHWTLFSQLAGLRPLDLPANRLCRFVSEVLDGSRRFSAARYDPLKELIRRNCTFLWLQAVALNPDLYSRGFLRTTEPFSPVRFAYTRRRHETLRRRYERVRSRLADRGRIHSIFDLLGGTNAPAFGA